MRVLLTGAAGFIGRHVYQLLQTRGHEVTGIDAFLSQVHGEVPKQPTFYVWRTSVGNAALQWAKDPNQVHDCVVHLAAHVGVGQSQTNPVDYLEHNVMETGRLWQAIMRRRSQVKKVVVASSMAIFGEGAYKNPNWSGGGWCGEGVERDVKRGWNALRWRNAGEPIDPDPTPVATSEFKTPMPTSVYAMSKWDTEMYSRILGATYNIPTVALRFFNVYGAGQSLSNPYTGALAMFACRLLNGKPPMVFEDGLQTRDFIHVSDVAEAVVAAAETDGLAGPFNVGTGKPTTVLDLVEALRAQIGGPPPQVLNEYRVGDVRHCFSCPVALREATGWSAKLSLEDGLQRTVPWIRDQPKPADRIETAITELRIAGLVRKPEECT